MTVANWLLGRKHSFCFAFSGFARLLGEANFRIHLAALGAVLCMGIWLRIGAMEWAAIAITVALVLMAEAFNTALELLADAVAPERHPLVGAAKDVAATAVLLSAAGAVGVACFLFLPKLWLRFG